MYALSIRFWLFFLPTGCTDVLFAALSDYFTIYYFTYIIKGSLAIIDIFKSVQKLAFSDPSFSRECTWTKYKPIDATVEMYAFATVG